MSTQNITLPISKQQDASPKSKCVEEESQKKQSRSRPFSEDDVAYVRLDAEKHTLEFVDVKLDDVQVALYNAGMLG